MYRYMSHSAAVGMRCEQSCSPAQDENSLRQWLLHRQQCHSGKLSLGIPVFLTCLLSRLFKKKKGMMFPKLSAVRLAGTQQDLAL